MTKLEMFRLSELQGCFALSLNEEYISASEKSELKLSNNDQLAVIPPLSGG